MSKFSDYLANITDEDKKVLESGSLKLTFDGVEYTIENNFYLRDIKADEGFTATMLNYKTIVINNELNQDLINEGIAREIVSKIQNLRKSSGFDIADRIDMTYNGPKEVKEAIKAFKTYIMDEVLAKSLKESDEAENTLQINEYEMNVTIKQVK